MYRRLRILLLAAVHLSPPLIPKNTHSKARGSGSQKTPAQRRGYGDISRQTTQELTREKANKQQQHQSDPYLQYTYSQVSAKR